MFYPLTHAHQEAQDGPSSERDRHFNVYRTLCGPAEVAPREGRDVRGRIGRQEWDFSDKSIQLGIGNQRTVTRPASQDCGISRRGSQNASAKKIISRLWCRIFKVLETFSGKNPKFKILPIDNILNTGYTTRTTLESHLCCLLQNPCTCAGYALENPGRTPVVSFT